MCSRDAESVRGWSWKELGTMGGGSGGSGNFVCELPFMVKRQSHFTG